MPVSDQGPLSGRYMLIPRTLIFLTRADHVLLLKGATYKRLWAGRYNGVGGHVEAGEGLLAAAYRELAEETGVECADLWLCGVVHVDTGQSAGVGIFVLRGEYSGGEVGLSPDGLLEWVPMDGWSELPLVEDLSVLLPRVLAMRRGDPPFFARSRYEEGRLVVTFENE